MSWEATFHYVPLDEVGEWLADGWTMSNDMAGTCHGAYSVLMMKEGPMESTRIAPTDIRMLVEDVHGEVIEMADKSLKAGYIDWHGRQRLVIHADILFAAFAAEFDSKRGNTDA